MQCIPFDEWRRIPGAEVEVWRDGSFLYAGFIDSATEDSAIAWLAAGSHGPRRILERADGIELRISPEQAARRAERPSGA